jgi:CHAT domain-containing protein
LKEFSIQPTELQNSDEINSLKEKISNLKINYEQFVDNLETEYPDYYNIKYQKNEIDLDIVKNTLNEDQIIIEYIINQSFSDYKSEIAIIAISKDSSSVFKFNIDSCLIEKILDFRKSVSTIHQNLSDYHNYINLAYDLYQDLVKPVESLIKSKKIIIIPDNILYFIPFEALISDSSVSVTPEYHLLNYLIKKNPVSYAFSFSTLRKKSDNHKINTDFEYDFEIIIPQLKDQQLSEYQLKRINFDTDEFTSGFKKTICQNDTITVNNFISEEKNSRITQLVTHGIVDLENPVKSKLIFSYSDSTNDCLYAFQLYGMKINSDLIVLNTCNSGIGEIIRGEGIMSFSRAFYYAGVPSLVSTLWSVGDESSSEIIFNFYKNLKKSLSKSEALQKSKIYYLENTFQTDKLQPYYWAGITLTGDDSHVFKKSYFVYICLTLILIITIFPFFKFKK